MTRALTVLDAGPLTTVQDRGRRGWAHLGVPRAGALDAPAAGLANRLVGNGPDAGLLETTLGGVVLRVSSAMSVAVTGAPGPVDVDGRAVPRAEPLALRAGAVLRVGPATEGVRAYVAVAGGVDVPPVLGSRATDTLAWVGPPRVVDGDVLPVGRPSAGPAPVDVAAARPWRRPAVLRLHVGARADWFTGAAVGTLLSSSYDVTGESNRVGLRLRGPALERAREGELPSEGIVLGALQVPPDGQPLVFLHDHPTTGGYPVVGVVEPADLWQCAQLRPGEQVRFTRP